MKFDARKLSTEEQHLLRRLAVQRVFDGEPAAEVTRCYGLGDRTIYKWLKVAREEGLDALSPKPRLGRGRALSDFEAEEVKRWILSGDPRQYGFDFGLWTRQIVSDLIKDRFNVELGLTAVGELLHRVGLSPQKPMRRAYERDDAEIEKWKKQLTLKSRKVLKNRAQRYFG